MQDQRTPVSFRLDPEIMRLLAALKAHMHLNATAVIVTALRELAKREGVE